jgi:hypothetical protein
MEPYVESKHSVPTEPMYLRKRTFFGRNVDNFFCRVKPAMAFFLFLVGNIYCFQLRFKGTEVD